jgi:hypothetical protein
MRGTDQGKVILDVAAAKVQDLYNDFDRTAPYLKRDLDQDLADYLVDCVREIGRKDFVIRINLVQRPDDVLENRVKESIENFFLYLKELEVRTMKKMLRTSLTLFTIGLGILAMAVWVNRIMTSSENVIAHVFAEGLTVAAWVSLWEALATFLIQWTPHRQDVRLFDRIAHAPLYVQAQPVDPLQR